MFDRVKPTTGDLIVLLLSIVPGMGAAPDPQAAIDMTHALLPLLVSAASAFGGIVAKSVIVLVFGYVRASGRKLLRDGDPKNDALGHALVEVADRGDPAGAKPDDGDEAPPLALVPPPSPPPPAVLPLGASEPPKKGPDQ